MYINFQICLNISVTTAKWYKNDQELKADRSKFICTKINERVGLEIRGVSKIDEGVYKCEVKNEVGSSCTSAANLQVLRKRYLIVALVIAKKWVYFFPKCLHSCLECIILLNSLSKRKSDSKLLRKCQQILKKVDICIRS